ncbi:OmpA family protein [Saccharomonospora glauca]|jgi:outer membrane protein OmpA-like peptidoglycan-associated protein|uniref:Outer membrane protein/peptidoglycan-associated (Lipo)protein n=1 Tax=Saccharomonospora glauca K62 TaxID=928724 RepID=I1D6X1_9PSEU|nr:OmpA family protein [Saccharomonospora glauca]EIF00696.1 outer membrane protein/peptidoglycan-associated (lipo)protein [Saccharomonospora glauca K62]
MRAPRVLAALAALAAVLISGVLALVATLVERDDIEADLAVRSQEALARYRVPADVVDVAGRDATVLADSPRSALLAKAVVENVDGVRSAAIVIGSRESAGTGRVDTAVDPDAPAKARLQRSLDRQLTANPITFLPNSARLTSDGEKAVRRVAESLTEAPTDWRFEVGGHAARVSGADSRSAEELSRARAETVAEELVSLGVSPDQVKAIGYGDARPLSKHGTAASDRRVEIRVR